MITLCKTWLRETDRNYLLFLLASIFLGIGQSVDGATLTNYLKENFQMLIVQRSALEFPRASWITRSPSHRLSLFPR